MATLRDIRGTNIPIRASDPANPQVGEVWYNTTTIPLTMYDSTGIGPIAAGVVVHGPQSPDTAVLLYASPGTWTTGTSSPARIGSASAIGS